MSTDKTKEEMQNEAMNLKEKLVFSDALGGYILDVPEELRDKILVNHFNGQFGDDCYPQPMGLGMDSGCGGNGAKIDPCANLGGNGQMICRNNFLCIIYL